MAEKTELLEEDEKDEAVVLMVDSNLQAKYIGQLMKTILEKNRNRDKNVNPKGVTGITLWGLYDTISWHASCSPLLLTPESPIQKLLSMNLSTLQNQLADRK